MNDPSVKSKECFYSRLICAVKDKIKKSKKHT